MPLTRRQQIGNHAEAQAALHIEKAGLTIVERNYHCRFGEIDCIALSNDKHNPCLVIIEVRARQQKAFGQAAETVDYHKQQKIIRATQVYLQHHPKHQALPIRFDVIGIHTHDNSLDWIKDAFQAEG